MEKEQNQNFDEIKKSDPISEEDNQNTENEGKESKEKRKSRKVARERKKK